MAPWLESVRNAIVDRDAAGALPHALLLLGAPGAGAELAHELVGILLCRQREAGSAAACGQCTSCQRLAADTHPDVLICRAESKSGQITVDQVRHLIDRSTLTGSVSQRRLYVVEGADHMNRNAANALLKTLEEPPPETVVVLTASRRSRLPATIISRCQLYPLPAAGAAGPAWLMQRCPQIPEDQVGLLLDAAGDPHAALAFVENESEEVLQGLTEPLAQILRGVLSGEADLPELAAQWHDGLAALRLARLARLWRDLVAHRLGYGDRAQRARLDELAGLTAAMDLASLLRCYEQTVETRRLTASPVRVELQVESLLAGVQQDAGAAKG